MTNRTQLTRRFFAIARTLGLDEEEWRGFTEGQKGTRSLRDLSDEDLSDVVEALAAKQTQDDKPKNYRPKSKHRYIRKAYALWGQLARDGVVQAGHKPLDAFTKRQTGIANTEWLTAFQANKVIEALKDMQARHQAKGCLQTENGIGGRG